MQRKTRASDLAERILLGPAQTTHQRSLLTEFPIPPASADTFGQPDIVLGCFTALNDGILAARQLDGTPTTTQHFSRHAIGKPTYNPGPRTDQTSMLFYGRPDDLREVFPYVSSFAHDALNPEQHTPEQINQSRLNIASALAYVIIKLHPYPDGNKATARAVASWAMQNNLSQSLDSEFNHQQPEQLRTETILAATRYSQNISPKDTTALIRMLTNIARITDSIDGTLMPQTVDDETAYARNVQALSGTFYKIRNRELKQRLAILMMAGHLGAAACHVVLGEHRDPQSVSRREAKKIIKHARALDKISTILTVESILQNGQFGQMTDIPALSDWAPRLTSAPRKHTLQEALAAVRARTRR